MYLCGKKKMEHIRTDFGLLERARTCWDAASGFRADRDRNKRFTYGDQWSDLVDDGVSKVPEETLIRRQGNTPLKNNLIRRLVRNVLGVYRNRWTLPECVARDPAESVRTATMQRLMHFNIATNRMEELYSRSMEEFLIGGLVVHKKWFGSKGNRTDCWTDFVQPDRFIIDPSTRDFRGWDITLVGEIHDMSFDEICSSFCTSAEERKALRDIYRTDNGGVTQTVPFGSGERSPSFHTPANAGACRVIEIWTLEHPSRYACHDTASGRRFRVNEEDCDRRRAMIRSMYGVISGIDSALMFFILAVAAPAIIFLYGSRWEDSIPIFRILAVFELLACLKYYFQTVCKIYGRTSTVRNLTFVEIAVQLALLLGFYHKGIIWIAWTQIGGVACTVTMYSLIYCRLTELRRLDFLGDFLRPLLAPSLACVVALVALRGLQQVMAVNAFLGCVFVTLVYGLVLVGVCEAVRPAYYLTVRSKLLKRKA